MRKSSSQEEATFVCNAKYLGMCCNRVISLLIIPYFGQGFAEGLIIKQHMNISLLVTSKLRCTHLYLFNIFKIKSPIVKFNQVRSHLL